MAEIVRISEEDILKFWQTKLWPERKNIELISAMLYLGGHSMENFNLPRAYLGVLVDDKIVGVNSGHECADETWRSRGLWVDSDFRGRGLGISLLKATIEAATLKCNLCWSLPRKTSWKTYHAAGFYRTSDWFDTETSDANAYCRIVLR